MSANQEKKKPSVHLWEPPESQQLSSSSSGSGSGVFALFSSFSSRKPKPSSRDPKSPNGARSPEPSKSGSSSPLSVRARKGPAKILLSSDVGGQNNEPPGTDFNMGKVIMPLNKALKVVVDVNAEIKVLEKCDSWEDEGFHAERRRLQHARKAEELVQRLNSIHVLDITERRTFQPLYDRVMSGLVPFLIDKDVSGSSGSPRARRNSVFRAAEQQQELLTMAAAKLAKFVEDHRAPDSRQPQSPSSRRSWEAGDCAERDDTDLSVASTLGPHSTSQRNPESVTTSALRNSADSLGSVNERLDGKHVQFDLGSGSGSTTGTMSLLPRNKASSLSDLGSVSGSTTGTMSLLPRNNSASSLFDFDSVSGSTTGTMSLLPRNNSASSLSDFGSVSGSTTGTMSLLPRNNSASSLFDLDSESESEEKPVLPRNSSSNSLFEGLLELQTHGDASENSDAQPLFNALRADESKKSSIGDDSDATSILSPTSPKSSNPSLFDALLALQDPGSRSISASPAAIRSH